MFKVNIIEDSISKEGKRITTFELAYPRYIHAELLTHRAFSRNSSSSRAVPVAKASEIALAEMVEPIRYGANQAGMQASSENLQGNSLSQARAIWRNMAEVCTRGSRELAALGLHKQWANRPTEWFSNIRTVLTATEFNNWFELRAHPDAQPEIQELAMQMKGVISASIPKLLKPGEWHLPYVTAEERADGFFKANADNAALLRQVSAARCCRVSYLKHDGSAATIADDLDLCEKLVGAKPLHASPFEHQATPDAFHQGDTSGYQGWEKQNLHGNFVGWIQNRKLIESSFTK